MTDEMKAVMDAVGKVIKTNLERVSAVRNITVTNDQPAPVIHNAYQQKTDTYGSGYVFMASAILSIT